MAEESKKTNQVDENYYKKEVKVHLLKNQELIQVQKNQKHQKMS